MRGLQREGIHPYLESGSTAPGLFALSANRYMHTFGTDRRVLAKVAVKNHANGALNPKAHFQTKVTEEQVLNAQVIAYPFGLYDCCPTTDGAAAAILCRADLASKFRKELILVRGSGLAVMSGKPFLDPTVDYLGFPSILPRPRNRLTRRQESAIPSNRWISARSTTVSRGPRSRITRTLDSAKKAKARDLLRKAAVR